MANLPPELILTIVEDVAADDGGRASLSACVLVSRDWSVCARRVRYRTLRLTISGRFNTDIDHALTALRADLSLCRAVRHLRLESLPGEPAGPYLATLRRLRGQLNDLAGLLPGLESVFIDSGRVLHPTRDTDEDDTMLPAASVGNVKRLHFTSWERCGPSVRQVLTLWPNVETVHLNARATALQAAAESPLPALRTLCVDNFKLPHPRASPDSFLSVHISNLTHLQLVGVASVDLFPPHDLPRLRFLAFIEVSLVSINDRVHAIWQCIACYRHLETLIVGGDIALDVLPFLAPTISNFGFAPRISTLDAAFDFVEARNHIGTVTTVDDYVSDRLVREMERRCLAAGRQHAMFGTLKESSCHYLSCRA